MASLHSHGTTLPLILLLLISFVDLCLGSRKLSSLYQPPPTILTYHGGALLEGHVPISILWYGKFSPAQRSIISDFLLSLTPTHHHLPTTTATTATTATTTPAPSVSKWWTTVDSYVQEARKKKTQILLTNQLLDEGYSMGKYLRRPQISELAGKLGVMRGGLAVVLTAEDVAVEGFCSSACGLHASRPAAGVGRLVRAPYIWVGNAERQCPGQCAWPFHRPVYGPQGPALRAPNGDVGLDGMVINLATLVAGAVTNPFGGGFFQGDAAAPVEVAGACPGVYGRGAYPGYAGELRVDRASGGSYNVVGVNGRKYLVPAMLDPVSHSCLPMV